MGVWIYVWIRTRKHPLLLEVEIEHLLHCLLFYAVQQVQDTLQHLMRVLLRTVVEQILKKEERGQREKKEERNEEVTREERRYCKRLARQRQEALKDYR